MEDRQVAYLDLVTLLQERARQQYGRNLTLVALPMEKAHSIAPKLAQDLQADYLDFDRELIQELEADDWNEHVQLERAGNLRVAQHLAQTWLRRVGQKRVSRSKPLVVGNLNLAVRYSIDVAALLYDASQNGQVVITAGGDVQRGTLLIHRSLPQTGAGSPVFELVTDKPASQDDRHIIQDRLF